MEEKLAAYRARKAKEKATEQSIVNRLRKFISPETSDDNSPKKDMDESTRDAAEQPPLENRDLSVQNPNQSKTMFWTLLVLKLILWLCVWGIFTELQFGAVFFTLSLIIFIYFNTRSGRKDSERELSAYSVFNKDCERIQGTLTAEQMQREMFRVPGLPS